MKKPKFLVVKVAFWIAFFAALAGLGIPRVIKYMEDRNKSKDVDMIETVMDAASSALNDRNTGLTVPLGTELRIDVIIGEVTVKVEKWGKTTPTSEDEAKKLQATWEEYIKKYYEDDLIYQSTVWREQSGVLKGVVGSGKKIQWSRADGKVFDSMIEFSVDFADKLV